MKIRAVATCVVIVGMTLALATPAAGHAVLVHSEPSNGEELARAPGAITLTFSEEPDPKVARIRVLDTTGRNVTNGPVHRSASDAHAVSVDLTTIPKGVYTVTWRVLSRLDGHVTGGAFAFGVGVSPAGAVLPRTGDSAPTPSPVGVAARWLFYAGLASVVGASWVGFRTSPAAAQRLRVLARAGTVLAILGIIEIAETQRRDAQLTFGSVFGTSIGRGLLWRAIPIVVIAVALMFARARTSALSVAGLGAIGAMGAHVMFGHAAAGSFAVAEIAAQWIHFISFGVWIGGLAALMLVMGLLEPGERAKAVRRYSAVALFAVILLASTGLIRALHDIKTWHQLFATSFGLLVILKASLLGGLVVLGALNRYRNVPRAEHEPKGLMRVARAELGLAVIVLAATGLLTSVSPARTAVAQSNSAGIVVLGADLGTTVRATLNVSPGIAGPNAFVLELADYDSRKPFDADRVSLSFRHTGVQTSTLVLPRAAPGRYSANGSNLAFEGKWNIGVLAQSVSSSVDVDLPITVRASQTIVVIPGSPVVYDVTLATGPKVQFYIDPGRPGANEIHATFTTPAGREFEGVRAPEMTASRDGGAAQTLVPRTLSPGHFVASVQLTPGKWRFDATVIAPDGTPLHAFFEQTIRKP